jgi:transglutaminase/protease-like cytokinesis protein 3
MNFTSLGCVLRFTEHYAKTLRQLTDFQQNQGCSPVVATIQQTLHQNDDLNSAKMSEMISGASRLQIQCGLFL